MADTLGYINAAVLAVPAINCNHQVKLLTFWIAFLHCNCVPPVLLDVLEYKGKFLVVYHAPHV